MVSIGQFIVWLIIGLLGGSLARLIIKRERGGFGGLRNLGLGLVGAFVDGLLFRLLRLFPELDRVTISARDRRCRIDARPRRPLAWQRLFRSP